MKKSILMLVLIICITIQTKAQQKNNIADVSGTVISKPAAVETDYSFSKNLSAATSNNPAKDYDYYVRKKKNNLTAGGITLGAGLLLSGIGWATASNSKSIDNDATAAILLIAGAASGIASIPLMIMAMVYGHKAKVAFSNQKTGFGVPSNVRKNIAGLTMSFLIGK